MKGTALAVSGRRQDATLHCSCTMHFPNNTALIAASHQRSVVPVVSCNGCHSNVYEFQWLGSALSVFDNILSITIMIYLIIYISFVRAASTAVHRLKFYFAVNLTTSCGRLVRYAPERLDQPVCDNL